MIRRILSQNEAVRGLMARFKTRNVSPPPEVDTPTYEIVGEIERYDQRDHPNARRVLVPGSAEYEDYYSRRPELKKWDDENRQRRKKCQDKKQQEDPIGSQLAPAVFYGRRVLGLPDIVAGKVSVRERIKVDKVDADPQAMAWLIKSYANYLGAGRVRITRLDPNWLYTHYASPYTLEPYGKPVSLNYKYIICMAFPQNLKMMASGDGIAEHVEVGWMYSYSSLVTVIMAQFVRNLGWPSQALPSENSPFLVVPTFVDAGIGEQGRTSHVVTKEFGNNFRPGAVATDMPLAIDRPVDFGLQDFCEKCKICADECPPGAISKGNKEVVRGVRVWHFDGDKCRRYWDSTGRSCGICQYVCPWNLPSNWFHNTIRELNQRSALMRKLAIVGHHLVYGRFKRGPQPEWIVQSEEALNKQSLIRNFYGAKG